MKKFLIKNKSGFTLVETLVALSIFSMSIVAVMSMLGQGIADTNYAKNKMTASYLAQEGIEYTRNFRDNFLISSDTDWNDFVDEITGSDKGCADEHGCWFNPAYMTFFPCASNWCTLYPLKYTTSTGSYDYSASGTNTIFSRQIKVTELLSPDEMQITSTVSWMQGSTRREVVFSEVLFNWVE